MFINGVETYIVDGSVYIRDDEHKVNYARVRAVTRYLISEGMLEGNRQIRVRVRRRNRTK